MGTENHMLDKDIMYFPKFFHDPESFLEEIYNFSSDCISDWQDWGREESFKYGKTKSLNCMELSKKYQGNEVVDRQTEYLLNRIYQSFACCARIYLKNLEFDKKTIGLVLERLSLSTFGLNKYSENVSMGPHIDRDKNNQEAYFVIILYMNDNYDGGEISFINQGVTIKPNKGDVLIFPGDERFTHEVYPSFNGEKILINHHLNIEEED